MSSKEVVHTIKHGRCRVEVARQKGQKGHYYSVRPYREYEDPETGEPRRAWSYFARDRKNHEKAEADAWAWIDSQEAESTTRPTTEG